MITPISNALKYYQLKDILRKVHKSDKIILLGDFNAPVGNGRILWPGVIGVHGVRNQNKEIPNSNCVQSAIWSLPLYYLD